MSRKPTDLVVPAATRSTTSSWRDPRLWVGVALVAGSVVAGSQVLASADDTTTVWATVESLPEGHRLVESDLRQVRLRFVDDEDAARYVALGEEFPDDVTLSRPLGSGELLARSALGSAQAEDVLSLSLALPPEEVPHDLGVGSRVDVWVVGEGRDRTSQATLVLEDVGVQALPAAAATFAASGGQQVVLGVPTEESSAMAEVLAASGDGAVRLVGRAG